MDIAEARARAVLAAPYFAALLFALRVREAKVGTAMVTKNGVVAVDPEFWSKLTEDQRAYVLLHELLHLALDHHARRGSRDPERWNAAADLAVGSALRGLKGKGLIREPEGVLLPGRLGLPWGLSAEEYYELLPEEGELPVLGGKSCGSGAGGRELFPEIEAEPGLPEHRRKALVRACAEEAFRHRGELPGELARFVSEVLSPSIPWYVVLGQVVRSLLVRAQGRQDYTLARPSRRSDEAVLPSLRKPELRVAAVVDTSGSVSERELSRFVAEVEGILSQFPGVVLACDATVHAKTKSRKNVKEILKGGGGTDLRVGIAEALKEGPDVIVVLTDGYTPWPEEAPPVPVVVALLPGGAKPPGWAKVVEVRP